jgi:hypothetical protein
MALLDEKTLLRPWTRAIGPLDELALKRIRRAFPLLDTSVMGNAGVQPAVPHIEQHVSLPLFNLCGGTTP